MGGLFPFLVPLCWGPPPQLSWVPAFLQLFGGYVLEQQWTDLMLTCLEVVSHEVPEEDEQWVSFLLNAAREDPISWFASVSAPPNPKRGRGRRGEATSHPPCVCVFVLFAARSRTSSSSSARSWWRS